MVLALDNLQNALSYDVDIASQGNQIAYALYVLARNRRASATDLRYYSESQLNNFGSPMARAHLGAALALYGDQAKADEAFASALTLAQSGKPADISRGDYGSALRDDAAMLALAAEARPVPQSVPAMMDHVSKLRLNARWTSTQEEAWMLMAARAIKEGASAINLTVDGAAHEGVFSKNHDRRGAGSQFAETGQHRQG